MNPESGDGADADQEAPGADGLISQNVFIN